MPTNLDVVTVIEPNSSIWPLTPKEFWKWREAFYQLILKEFQVRFQETYLGYAWVILQPLIMLGIFSIVLFRGNLQQTEALPYSLYVLSGLVFWTFISNAFIQGSLSLLDNRGLITQTNLKRALIPLSVLASKLIDLIVGLIFLFVWISFDSRVHLQWSGILMIVDVICICLFLTGVTFGFSAICIQLRDVRYIIPFLSQALFFATPILYFVPSSSYAWILYLNPLTVFMLALRDHLFGTSFVSPMQYGLALVGSLFICILGGIIFKKFESRFADII